MSMNWSAETSDEELLANLLDDTKALEVFYRRYFDATTTHLARRCRDPQIIADVGIQNFLESNEQERHMEVRAEQRISRRLVTPNRIK